MKRTISGRIARVFMLLMAGTMLLCWLINGTCLVAFYAMDKRETLWDAYDIINYASEAQKIETQEFYTTIDKVCDKGNLSMIILNQEGEVSYSSSNDAEMFMLNRKILEYIYEFEETVGENEYQELYAENGIVMQLAENKRTKRSYMELWGKVGNGSYFLIRTPMESIQESVAVSNRFFLYLGLFSVLVSYIVIRIATKRIAMPIRELVNISKEMANLNFDVKYKKGGTFEVDELGDSMNTLSEKLEKTISELKTANNELKNDIAEKEKVDEMRRDFLSNVSHELKTPIALIQGYAEGLKEGVLDDEESKEFYCEVIMDEANKMNNLVKSLLELGQIESGGEKIAFERIDIVAMIRGVIQNFKLNFEQNDIRVLFDVTEPVYVWGDEFKVEEVFRNFLTNGIHHAEGEKVIEIKLEQKEKEVVISVFNTGNPIPEEDIPRIWDKFYKVDKARTRDYGGNGIGLSIVKAIMESMHKSYGVENYKNGVKFWFTLDSE